MFELPIRWLVTHGSHAYHDALSENVYLLSKNILGSLHVGHLIVLTIERNIEYYCKISSTYS